MNGRQTIPPVLSARDRRMGLVLDEQTGLPTSLVLRQQERDVVLPLTWTVELITEGQEVWRTPWGGRNLEYVDTTSLSTLRRTRDPLIHRFEGASETYSVTVQAENWQIVWHYTFRTRHPRLELSFDIGPLAGSEDQATLATLRDVCLVATLRPADLSSWFIEAPGNGLRPGVPADALQIPVGISSATGSSAGLVALHDPRERQVLVLWPFVRTELSRIRVQRQDGTLQMVLNTDLAGRLLPGEVLHYEGIYLDALESTWAEVRDTLADWYDVLSLRVPNDRPAWVKTASIFEVHIGSAVFKDGYRYAPYLTVRDLQADLGRIKDLGYNVLQIMPHHPYPSYNVHDYADITTTYGNEEELRELIATCHTMGMRVILDILMHGVLDQEVISQTAARIRSGPWFSRLGEQAYLFTRNPDDYPIGWSRHILDFEPYWSAGSPPRHPLVDKHPEWFMRDSNQNIIGVYTKAFDASHPEWQEYYMQAAENLVRRLDIDGFRFDAPTYNDFPNWSKATEKRASYSPLGGLELFERLRPRLKALKEDLVLFTQSSGALFRQAMDITYSYEEAGIIQSILGQKVPGQEDRDERWQPLSVRHGRDLAAWWRERDAVLPPGSWSVHHVDEHDSFWFSLPGTKWRREQYGLPATRALLAIFALSGGAYMTYVGGEQGIEAETRRVHHLRKTLPEIAEGVVIHDVLRVAHEDVYGVMRRLGERVALLLVNLSPQSFETIVTFDAASQGLSVGEHHFVDAWPAEGGRALSLALGQEPCTFSLAFEPYQVFLFVGQD